MFRTFYFPGFTCPDESEPVDRQREATYASIEDVSIGLNISVNEIGFKSDMDNGIEGVMGLGIPSVLFILLMYF